MRKNIFFIILLTVILILLLIRCGNNQFLDESTLDNTIEIAPYPERTVELITLYFADFNNEHLVKEIRAVERINESKEESILRELMKGPMDRQLQPTIPNQVKLYSIITVDDTTYINFSKEFATNFRGGESSEITTIYSIVNSLTELRHVDWVKIQVEGERLDIYQNHMTLKEAYGRNDRIIHGAFPSAIEVIRTYFNHIVQEQYRYAYDLIYRPAEINLDYSMYFHHVRSKKLGVTKYTDDSFSIFKEPGLTTIVMDYEEIMSDGTVNRYEKGIFRLKNDLGEWKIVYESLIEN
ncbi:GerMN domain-containing protein [Alkaliphilus peptidifermentans]|uniref:Sporulation and spore germination n=1 Tax=Alkaliphilus peptidifermentans DSM 18978 TaxID=1120976 RepID=A0A1G5J629_9FIRM|nr:GerMN domain-containing protein [Alkaliphilus peptidifermentans]SCY83825.1 Sporulation and spore germination [Alkaliphilus peptidifermentans DSM 18978]